MYIKDKDGNYVPTPSSKGADGREVSLRVANNYIQWRYPDTEWTNLVPLSSLKGEPGPEGPQGPEGSNEISIDTATALNGLLKGNGSTVQVAQSGVDYAAPATDTVVTASASAWSNNTITLSVTGVMTDSKLEIGLSDTATDEQYAAATAAQIRATGSGDGTVTLKAVAAPSIDLPILIRRLS